MSVETRMAAMGIFHKMNIEILPSGVEDSLFYERENQVRHSPYQWEQMLVGYIRDGNLSMVERFLSMATESGIKIGKLSDSELRQAQYHAAILSYQASRAAIQGGVFEADAFNQSDAFTQMIDKATTPQEVIRLTQQALLDWTKAVYDIRFQNDLPAPIRACQNYMYENLHSRITLQDLAKVSGFSAPYLSALFKRKVGETISSYLMRLKIKAACEMLLNTDRSSKDIGFYLNFCSQSYFIRCFKRLTGFTPQQFRKEVMAQEKRAS